MMAQFTPTEIRETIYSQLKKENAYFHYLEPQTNSASSLRFESLRIQTQHIDVSFHVDEVTDNRNSRGKWESLSEKNNVTKLNDDF